MKLTIEDQTFIGTPEKVLSCLEAAGYAAIRAEQSPHAFFQYGEYIKREKGHLHGDDGNTHGLHVRKHRARGKGKD